MRYVLRRKSAAFQSLILRSTLIVVVLSPIATVLLTNAGIERAVIPVPLIGNNADVSKTDISQLYGTDEANRSGTEKLHRLPAGSHGTKQQAGNTFTGDERLQRSDAPLRKGVTDGIEDTRGHISAANPEVSQETVQKDTGNVPAPALSTGETVREGRWFLAGLYVSLFLIWAGVSLFFFLRIIFVFLCITYIRYSARPASSGYEKTCMDAAAVLGVQMPPVFQHPVAKGAFICGYFRPVVMLPGSENECFAATREVFLHELAHLARLDHLWNLLNQLAIMFLPVQPLLWQLIRRISDVSDYACDDYVLRYSGDSHSYAIQLFTIARTYNPGIPEATAGVGILAKPSPLYDRIERILDTSYVRLIKVRAFELVSVIVFFFSTLTVTGSVGFRGEQINGRRMPAYMAHQNIVRVIALKPEYAIENAGEQGAPSKKAAYVHAPALQIEEHADQQPDFYQASIRTEAESTSPEQQTMQEDDALDRQQILAHDPSPLQQVYDSSGGGGKEDNPDSSDTGMTQTAQAALKAGEIKTGGAEQTSESSTEEATVDMRFGLAYQPEFSGRNISALDQPLSGKISLKPIQIVIPVDYEHTEPRNADEALLFDMYRSLEQNKLYPVWSPDGDRIVITDRQYGIWMVPVQGGEPELIYRNDPVRFRDVTVRLTGIEPLCFAPGGSELTYKRYIIDEKMGSEVVVDNSSSPPHVTIMNPVPVIETVDIETGRIQVLAKGAAYDRWSSDGRLFMYTRLDADSFKELMIRDVYTGYEYAIDEFDAQRILLSPNDRYLMFNEDDIFMLPGTGELRRFRLSGDITFSDVSRDAHWILYTHLGSLYVYDTHSEQAIDLFPDQHISPNWARFSPDLTNICFSLKTEDNWEIYLYDFGTITGAAGIEKEVAPQVFELKGNFPNPFNASTTIQFSLPERDRASMVIYNIMGQRVRGLVSGELESGMHSVVWDSRDDSGRTVGTGTYMASLIAGNHKAAIRMTLVK